MIKKITDPQEIRNIFDKDNIETTNRISKNDLRNDDIIKFKNKKAIVLSQINRYIINEFYNDNLEHINDPEYNVEEVERPQYVKVYQRTHLPK